MDCTPWKSFRCESEDQLISKYPKPPKENDKQRKQVHFSERGNCASKKYETIMIIKTIKRYMHLWHVCMIMSNFLVGILVTV